MSHIAGIAKLFTSAIATTRAIILSSDKPERAAVTDVTEHKQCVLPRASGNTKALRRCETSLKDLQISCGILTYKVGSLFNIEI